ncbi:hypothetical protein PHEL85_2090 [Polaribacter sp. Hel1_85]|nr:hypothetical protein PHEL85_2090 [Polaribacter sp. Hel1_85]
MDTSSLCLGFYVLERQSDNAVYPYNIIKKELIKIVKNSLL